MKSKIILDYSANTHKNDLNKIQQTISAIKDIDTGKHEIIFKSQLFKEAGKNIVCSEYSFDSMYQHCQSLGYKCTASVFDLDSLNYLLSFDIPFVKIANNRNLDYLIEHVPRGLPVYISYDSNKIDNCYNPLLNQIDERMRCVSKYPADVSEYRVMPRCNISDHTIGFDLFNMVKPKIWEKHLIMKGDKGLDAGPFAVTPEDLKEIL